MRGELFKQVRAVRKLVPARDRTQTEGDIEYSCDCGAIQHIALAHGVGLPGQTQYKRAPVIPAPSSVECPLCDGEAHFVPGSYRVLVGGRLPAQSYFRIPSRNAMTRIGRFEAHLVVPQDSDFLTEHEE